MYILNSVRRLLVNVVDLYPIFQQWFIPDSSYVPFRLPNCPSAEPQHCKSVFRIWIRRIRKFLDLPDLDPLSSRKNRKKNLYFLLFCDFLMTFYLWRMMEMYLQKVITRKKLEVYFWKKQDMEPDPHLLVRGTDPRTRILTNNHGSL